MRAHWRRRGRGELISVVTDEQGLILHCSGPRAGAFRVRPEHLPLLGYHLAVLGAGRADGVAERAVTLAAKLDAALDPALAAVQDAAVVVGSLIPLHRHITAVFDAHPHPAAATGRTDAGAALRQVADLVDRGEWASGAGLWPETVTLAATRPGAAGPGRWSAQVALPDGLDRDAAEYLLARWATALGAGPLTDGAGCQLQATTPVTAAQPVAVTIRIAVEPAPAAECGGTKSADARE